MKLKLERIDTENSGFYYLIGFVEKRELAITPVTADVFICIAM